MLHRLEIEDFDRVYQIMDRSFPTDEHRPYQEQKALFENPEYGIYTSDNEENGCIQGFLAVWDLEEYIFIEHFAVDPDYRNKGIGEKMLTELKMLTGKPICLEVESPEDELTKRRVGFYERNGFCLNPYPYVQPPLAKGQKEVPLLIMTTQRTVTEEEFERIRDLLYIRVYRI